MRVNICGDLWGWIIPKITTGGAAQRFSRFWLALCVMVIGGWREPSQIDEDYIFCGDLWGWIIPKITTDGAAQRLSRIWPARGVMVIGGWLGYVFRHVDFLVRRVR